MTSPLNSGKVPNIWNTYGLSSSPFFQEPLDPADGGPRPISLFVGREDVARRLLVRFGSNDGSRTTVEGSPGVGKTTFIQYVKAQASAPPSYLAHANYIRATSAMSHDQLALEIVKLIVRTLSTYFSPTELKSLTAVDEARRLVEEVERQDWQAGVSIFGTGGNIGRVTTKERPLFQALQFHDLLEALVTQSKTLGVIGILLHIDNMENLQEGDIKDARQLFRDSRDYLLMPGIHYVLASTAGFRRDVLAYHAQVGSIFPDPILLGPLEAQHTLELLKKRYEYLRVEGPHLISPIADEAIMALHDGFQGDLRGMLNALNDAAEALLGVGKSEPLTLDQIVPALGPSYRSRLENDLTRTAYDQLETAAQLFPETFRQTDLTKPLGLSPGRVNQVFRDWEACGAIRLVGTEGRSKFYTLSGYARIAFGMALSV